MTLGKLLKFRRTGYNMSVKDVAKKLNVTYQCLWQIEETERVASVETLEKLSVFYYIDMLTLLELNFKNSQAYKIHNANMEFYRTKEKK